MTKQKFFPEDFYHVDNTMSMEKIRSAEKSNDFVVGKVLLWNPVELIFKVDLGNNIHGYLPLNKISVYPPFKKGGQIDTSVVYGLVGKTICACITSISEDGEIYLSRKRSMKKVFKYLQKENFLSENVSFTCTLTEFCDSGAYFDIGLGLTAFMHISEFSRVRIKSSKMFPDFYKGVHVQSVLTQLTEKYSRYSIRISYKYAFDNLVETKQLHVDDVIKARLFDTVDSNCSGYYAHINPLTPAIMDTPNFWNPSCIEYGGEVLVRVHSISFSKVKLRFEDFVTT